MPTLQGFRDDERGELLPDRLLTWIAEHPFGGNVEDYLGRKRFLALILLAELAGNFFHIAADPHSTTPCIGASGGISAVIAFYALKFPHARLGFLAGRYYRYGWIKLPACGAFALWIAMQFFGAYGQIAGFGKVSAMAHVGGATVGVLAWIAWRKIELQPAKTETAAANA